MVIISTQQVSFCQICGKNIGEYPERLQHVYRCSKCGNTICVDCFYKHRSCNTRLCANCLAKGYFRQSSREWDGKEGKCAFKCAVYEDTSSSSRCQICDRTDSWFRVGDAIRYKIANDVDRSDIFYGIEG